jgi:hypothetical protein
VTRVLIRAVVLLVVVAAQARAQTPAPAAKPPDNPLVAPVRVQVVVARYQGDKRLSSLPYTLFVNVANRGVAQVRMGAEIPISTMTPATGGDSRQVAPTAGVSYERVGTEIDCSVRTTGDSRYFVELTISDKTVYSSDEAPRLATSSMNPTLRSFRSYNTLVLKDGQSTQFPAAADRITGEVVRIEVSLNEVK